MSRVLVVTACLTASLSLACTDADPTGANELVLAELAPFVEALRARGFQVEITGEPPLQFLTGVSTVLRVDGERVEVFEYSDGASAASEASWFSADGSSIITDYGLAVSILWVATPHLFLKGALITLYVGDTEPLLAALVEILGPQVAGR